MQKHLALLLFLALSLHSKEQKLELGVGAANIIFPDYLGSKSTRKYTFLYPYVDYRGEYFKVDKEGIKTEIFNIKDLKLSLSINGSLPVNSKNNKTREGMPNLGFTFEAGPKLNYLISSSEKSKLYFELPLRALFSTNINTIAFQGILTSPQLKYKTHYKKIHITIRSGLLFADGKYTNYFYEVKDEYATPTRAEFKAAKGYSGFYNKIELSYKKDSWWAGAALSHYDLRGAVFQNSPLVETKSAIIFGASIAYIFYNSSK